ncbi:MAG: phosphoenolpyruvate--protein phosphotransferase [Actinomycetaceae bacterium]|nr:phosphoenolpyruvate--protein phosphotransferase [Actinomycetaceae bacterium]MDY6083568.1 phosphoenolpyruvate--protein phosphotransferase [Actinomycetaceae bacterium]
MSTQLHGISVSQGSASGAFLRVQPAPTWDPNEPGSSNPDADLDTVKAAMNEVSARLQSRANDAEGDMRDVLNATAMLAKDKSLLKSVKKSLEAGYGVTHAVHVAVENSADTLRKLGGYMAQRVPDLYDVRDRVIALLRGAPEPGVPQLKEPVVLVADDLSPADTASLDASRVLAIVTQAGGVLGHTAILAAMRGIPAVIQVKGILGSLDGATSLAVDGGSGDVIIDPSEQEAHELIERANRRDALLSHSSGPGTTADGHEVELLANIGTPDDARAAAKLDVAGIGLFRTEFLYLGRSSAPSEEEQYTTYLSVFKVMEPRKVVVRTLDAGADKPLAFADLGKEANPALGKRGYRLAERIPDLLNTQLKALARAQAETSAPVWVMAPMIATQEEADNFVTAAHDAGLAHAGVMVEVPAAAIEARHVLKNADFASLGTNDLAQYTMASDRLDGELASLLDPWQPGVLNMVARACQGAQDTNTHLGVCGESGGDPLLALVLVGLGVQSLSMAPTKIPAVREALKMHSMAELTYLAQIATEAPTAHAAHDSVLTHVNPRIWDLL